MEQREEDLYATVILTPHFERQEEESEEPSLEDDDSSSVYQASDSSEEETCEKKHTPEVSYDMVLSHCMDYVRGEMYVERMCHPNIGGYEFKETYHRVFADPTFSRTSFIWSSNSGVTPEIFRIETSALYCKRNAMKEFRLTPQDMQYLADNVNRYGGWF